MIQLSCFLEMLVQLRSRAAGCLRMIPLSMSGVIDLQRLRLMSFQSRLSQHLWARSPALHAQSRLDPAGLLVLTIGSRSCRRACRHTGLCGSGGWRRPSTSPAAAGGPLRCPAAACRAAGWWAEAGWRGAPSGCISAASGRGAGGDRPGRCASSCSSSAASSRAASRPRGAPGGAASRPGRCCRCWGSTWPSARRPCSRAQLWHVAASGWPGCPPVSAAACSYCSGSLPAWRPCGSGCRWSPLIYGSDCPQSPRSSSAACCGWASHPLSSPDCGSGWTDGLRSGQLPGWALWRWGVFVDGEPSDERGLLSRCWVQLWGTGTTPGPSLLLQMSSAEAWICPLLHRPLAGRLPSRLCTHSPLYLEARLRGGRLRRNLPAHPLGRCNCFPFWFASAACELRSRPVLTVSSAKEEKDVAFLQFPRDFPRAQLWLCTHRFLAASSCLLFHDGLLVGVKKTPLFSQRVVLQPQPGHGFQRRQRGPLLRGFLFLPRRAVVPLGLPLDGTRAVEGSAARRRRIGLLLCFPVEPRLLQQGARQVRGVLETRPPFLLLATNEQKNDTFMCQSLCETREKGTRILSQSSQPGCTLGTPSSLAAHHWWPRLNLWPGVKKKKKEEKQKK